MTTLPPDDLPELATANDTHVRACTEGWAAAAHELVAERPELDGIGISDALEAVVSA